MKIVIGHLYYDLMNLYGEIGNIKVLENVLTSAGVKVEVKKLSLDDDISFDDLDLVYIGSGTEESRNIVLNDIKKYKDDINKAILNNKFFLITGNALSLFGKSLYGVDALNCFNYEVSKSDNRIVKEVVTKTNLIKNDIYGFMNHSDIYSNLDNCLFDNEGIHVNNFYGSLLIGPLLARNPMFTKYFVKSLIKSKDKNFKFKSFNFNLEEKAYNEYIVFKKTKKHIK